MLHVENSFILELFVIFVWAKVFAEVFEQVSLPGVLGEILAGVVLGPHALQFVSQSENTAALAQVGAIFLLFSVGLETRPEDLIRVGRQALRVASAGVAVPFAIGLGYTLWRGLSGHESTFVAAAMVATSVGITARVLRDMGVLATQPARIILGAAVFDDIFGMLVLALVLELASKKGVQWLSLGVLAAEAIGFAIFMIFLAPRLIYRIRPRIERISLRHAPLSFALAICLGLSVTAEKIGMAGIIGAFFAGLSFAEYAPEWQIESPVHGIAEFLTPFFFFAIGANLDLSVFSIEVLGFSLILSLLAIVSKILGCGLPVLGDGWRSMLQVGVGMTPRGEVAFIVALIGLQMHLISQATYAVVVFMTAVTTLFPPPFLRVAFRPLQNSSPSERPPEVHAHGASRWRYVAKTLIGAALCLGVALLVVRVWRGMPAKEPVPLLFIPVIISTAAIFGRAAGFLSSLVSGLTFSFLLFAPIHSWNIAEISARNNVVWMLLAGIAISYFMPTVTKFRS